MILCVIFSPFETVSLITAKEDKGSIVAPTTQQLKHVVRKKKTASQWKTNNTARPKTCCRNFHIWSLQITSFWSAVDRKQHRSASSRISFVCLWRLGVFVTSDPTPLKNMAFKKGGKSAQMSYAALPQCLEVLCWHSQVSSTQNAVHHKLFPQRHISLSCDI